MLTDIQKNWILALTGRELFTKSKELFFSGKIDAETLKAMNLFWLDEHNVKIDKSPQTTYKKPTNQYWHK
jgi:hypothetical protein